MAFRMILKFSKFMLATYFLCQPFSTSANAQNPNLPEDGAITRVADVLDVRHVGGKKLRVTFTAQENNGIQRYPISTIDRSMVKIDFTNVAAPPADVESLMLSGSAAAEVRRALFVGFSLHRQLRSRDVEEIRADVGDLLKELPAENLTVAAISQDSARSIADVTPEKSDNTNRILQGLQSLEPEGDGPALADTLCVAAERFTTWNLSDFRSSDQKVLVIFSTPGDSQKTEAFRAQNCWRILLDQGVRVFFISFGQGNVDGGFDLTAVAQDSGGYVHRVSGPTEMSAAIKNVIALLKTEYAVDVNAPSIPEEDQPLEIRVRISYHDTKFESNVFDLGFVIPELASGLVPPDGLLTGGDDSNSEAVSLKMGVTGAKFFKWVLLLMSVLIGVLTTFLFLRWRGKTIACATCKNRVSSDHSDCPYRKPSCVARLVYIGGPFSGQTIPLSIGESRLGRFPWYRAITTVAGKNIDWLHHGTITIEGSKAIYAPRKPNRDRINGWLVGEPRLLSIGSVVKIGDQNLRFEPKNHLVQR